MDDMLMTGAAAMEAAELAAAAAEAEAAAEEEQMSLDELADAFESRAETYGFLSHLYNNEVDEAFMAELLDMNYPVHTGNELMDEGYYHLAKYLSNEWVEPLTKLGVDYSATFLGNGVDTYSAAYPFESVYTSEKRLLMQGARDEVLAIYRSQNLDKASAWKTGEDHISVEFEFMRIMIARTIRALRAGNQDKAMHLIATQQNFLEDHIRTWVPVFTADVRRFSKTLFYQGLAELTDGFLQSEHELLAEMIVPGEDEEGEGGAEAAEAAPASADTPEAGE